MFGKQLTLLGHKGSVLLLEREECLLLTGSIAEADFEFFFAPQERHVAPMGHRRNVSPLRGEKRGLNLARSSDKGIGRPKLKFLLRFDQNVEYLSAPRGVCRILRGLY